jgi:mRNA-degrading endonuclease RelE of RelBE toxin-antitoxin system
MSGMYTVIVTASAKKNLSSLRKFGKETLKQIRRVLGGLEGDPYGMTHPLSAPLNAYRSLHVGRFRAVIKIVDKEVRVYVMAVGWHTSGSRDDIYQQFQRALKMGLIQAES